MSLHHPIELAESVADIYSGAVIQSVQIVVGSNKPHPANKPGMGYKRILIRHIIT